MARRAVLIVFVTAVLPVLLALPVLAAGSGKPESEERPAVYDEGVALREAGEFEKAKQAFEKAVRQKPRDPDALNMLAYTQRKTGELDRAIGNYKKALSLRPRFPQAREYLAEAYLQATLRELETLKGYGKDAESEHARLVQAIQAAVWDLPAATSSTKADW